MRNSLVNVRGKFSPELVEWVLNPESEITEAVEKHIDKLMEDRRKRVQIFLTGLVKRHVERVVFLMEKFPQVEAELFNEKRIKTMKNSDLIRLLGIIGTQVEDASDFLQKFVSADDLKAEPLPSRRSGQADLDENQEEETKDEDTEALKLLPSESRKRVMRVFRKLLTVVETVEERVEAETIKSVETTIE